MMWWDGFSWWWIGLMMFLMIAFWGGIIALIVWAVRRSTGHHSSRPADISSHSALDIAKERYARGEITKEQFDQIKRDLT